MIVVLVLAVVSVFLRTKTDGNAHKKKQQKFQDDWEKKLGSGLADRVDQVIRNTDIFFLALSSYRILVSNMVGIDLARKNMVWLTDCLDYVDLNVKPRNNQNSSAKA